MPFVEQSHREKPDLTIPGDRCYIWYRWMMDQWHRNRRWTTVDNIYAQVAEYHLARKLPKESLRALDLAWQVFFIMHVVAYEEEKKELNGDIE
jgi:hypothetical protein